jgi:hypothetical protein
MARTALLQIGTRPICRLHKASGQTLVQIKGRPLYLGKHGSPQSQQRYRRLIAE